ncbi:metal-dependent protein hydrolase, partial [Kipferlia bialata]
NGRSYRGPPRFKVWDSMFHKATRLARDEFLLTVQRAFVSARPGIAPSCTVEGLDQSAARPLILCNQGKYTLSDCMAVAILRDREAAFKDAPVSFVSPDEVNALVSSRHAPTAVVGLGECHDPSRHMYDTPPDCEDKYFQSSRVPMSAAGYLFRQYGSALIRDMIVGARVPNAESLSGEDLDVLSLSVYKVFVSPADCAAAGLDRMGSVEDPSITPEGVITNYTSDNKLVERIHHPQYVPGSWADRLDCHTQTDMFEKAVTLVRSELQRSVRAAYEELPAYKIIQQAYRERHNMHPSGRLMYVDVPIKRYQLQNALPEIERVDMAAKGVSLLDGPTEDCPYHVIFPWGWQQGGTYNALALKDIFTSTMRAPFHGKGLERDDLEAEIGYQGVDSVHATGFHAKGELESLVRLCCESGGIDIEGCEPFLMAME